MALAVLRVAPVKASALGAMSAHHTRSATKVDEHIAPARSQLNRAFVGSGDPRADVLAVASQYKMGKTMDDPVLAAEIILTASQEYFDSTFKNWRYNPSVLNPWIKAQMDFLKANEKLVGKTVSVTIHMDEAAPHIHAVTVPVADVRVKNRYTDRIEQRLSYTKIFGDDKATLAEARRLGTTATATKLGRLQTTYAESMQAHGLDIKRGASNTGRKHISPQEYRDAIARADSPAPTVPRVKNPEDTSKLKDAADVALHGQGAKIVTRHIEIAKRFQHAALKNANIAKEQAERISTLETELMITHGENQSLKMQMRILSESQQKLVNELRSNKALMKQYREITEYDVVREKAGTWDEVNAFNAQSGRSKFNPLDFIKYKHECDFSTAVYKLSEHFPPEQIADHIANSIHKTKQQEAIKQTEQAKSEVIAAIEKANTLDEVITEKVKTPATKAKEDIIDRQLNAIDASKYRITLMSNDKTQPSFNLGKGKGEDGAEKFYSKEEIKELIPTLSYRNSKGYNIFVTPMPDEQSRFILLDDIRDMEKARALEPCLIMQTSPNSRQALYKVSGDTEEAATRQFFNGINRQFGDEKISGLVHPIRLAGFTNRKPKHKNEKTGQFPFVTIIESSNVQSEKAQTAIKYIANEMENAPMPKPLKKMSQFKKDKNPETPIRTTDIDIPNMQKWYKQQIDYWQDKADLSKIDRRLATYLSEQGFSEKQAQSTILACSPDIQGRHGHELQKYLSGKTKGLEFALDVPEEREQDELDKIHEDTNYAVMEM